MSAKLINETIRNLKASKSNIRCADMKGYLKSLGFEVRNGKKGGHKLYFHDGISGFISGSYNCGHGKNPEIKPAYVGKLITMLEHYKSELIKYFGEE